MKLVSPAPQRARLDHLDALRGWAILGVMIIHCGSHFQESGIGRKTLDGAVGVQLFYTLSALTLFYTGYSQHAGERRWLRNFFIRRFFRIAPMFYLVVLYFYVRNSEVTLPHVLALVTFVNGFIPRYLNALFGEWSIAIEMTFYALVPLLYRTIKTVDRAIYLTVGALLVSGLALKWTYAHQPLADAYVWHSFRTCWFPNQFPAFTCGIVTFFILQRRLDPKLATPLMAIAVFMGVAVYFSEFQALFAFPHHLLYELMFVPLIISLHLAPNRFWVNPLMSYLGRISFSCYLLHSVVREKLYRYALALALPPLAQFLLLLLALAGVTALLASITYRWVELPGIALGKKLIAWLDRGDGARSTETTRKAAELG